MNTQQSPKFKNKDGSLTAYSFACGYVQEFELNGVRLQLYHEGAVYQVRAHDHNTGTRLFWDSFDSYIAGGLGLARKRYAQAVKDIKAQSKQQTKAG